MTSSAGRASPEPASPEGRVRRGGTRAAGGSAPPEPALPVAAAAGPAPDAAWADAVSLLATGSSFSMSSSTSTAWSRSAPLSNSGTTSRSGGRPSGTARRASSYTAAMSRAERVKLTTYRRHARAPKRPWIQAITRNVARTSCVCGDGGSPPLQLGQRPGVHLAVLPDLQLGQVEPERLRLPDQVLQLAERLPRRARRRQRVLHQAQVGQEPGRIPVAQIRVAQPGGAEPFGQKEQVRTVRLGRGAGRDAGQQLRVRRLGDLERAGQGRRRRGDRRLARSARGRSAR